MIGILDYGCGNLRSLENALEALGLAWVRTADPAAVRVLPRLILPGVGHFRHAMGELRTRALVEALRQRAGMGLPILGICLGMQLCFDASEEAPGTEGLGLRRGRFEAFAEPGLKVPHMGWSSVEASGDSGCAYFVHGYRLRAWSDPRPAEWLATAVYGQPFVAGFRSGRLAGLQFHPEKSGEWGLALLKEALTW